MITLKQKLLQYCKTEMEKHHKLMQEELLNYMMRITYVSDKNLAIEHLRMAAFYYGQWEAFRYVEAFVDMHYDK